MSKEASFSLGRVVATPGALVALAKAGDGFEGGHAVAYAVAERMPLDRWLRENGHADG